MFNFGLASLLEVSGRGKTKWFPMPRLVCILWSELRNLDAQLACHCWGKLRSLRITAGDTGICTGHTGNTEIYTGPCWGHWHLHWSLLGCSDICTSHCSGHWNLYWSQLGPQIYTGHCWRCLDLNWWSVTAKKKIEHLLSSATSHKSLFNGLGGPLPSPISDYCTLQTILYITKIFIISTVDGYNEVLL